MSTKSILAAVCLAATCAGPSERIESLRAACDVAGLVRLAADLKKDGRPADAKRALDAIGSIAGKEAEQALLAFLRGGDDAERSAARDLLIARKSGAVVPDLLAMLLNSLQTGGDGKELAAKIALIDPGAVKKAYADSISSAEAARKSGAAAAADIHLGNAMALQKLAGGHGGLSDELDKPGRSKQAARLHEMCESLVDAMENGQLTRSFELMKAIAAASKDEAIEGLVPEIERLSSLEESFYAVAQAQEKARREYDDAVKSNAAPAERKAKLSAYNARKSAMVLARRALERERRKLPALTERARQAVAKFRP